jgi:hypothetical protein
VTCAAYHGQISKFSHFGQNIPLRVGETPLKGITAKKWADFSILNGMDARKFSLKEGDYILDSPKGGATIRRHEKSTSISFREWTSNFSEGLFVMLKAYADETGTHKGADMIALAGLIESRDYWEKFNRKWEAVLDNYDADFFHYREFRKDANTKLGDPYYGWSDEKRRNFLFRLAMLVGESAVPLGGAYPVDHSKKIGLTHDPIDATIHAFYKSTFWVLDKHWPNYSGKVLFIFDDTSNKNWVGKIYAIHNSYKAKDSRIGGMAFENDKDKAHLALQAADFSTIHSRNNAREYIEAGGSPMGNQTGTMFDVGIIDFVVGKNIDPAFRNLPAKVTKKIIDNMREDEVLKRRNGFTGAYIPLKHFDFEKYGYKK